MKTYLETALACIADGLPIPVDLTATLLEQGIDVATLSITPEESLELASTETPKEL